jgi:hypothetical protein
VGISQCRWADNEIQQVVVSATVDTPADRTEYAALLMTMEECSKVGVRKVGLLKGINK